MNGRLPNPNRGRYGSQSPTSTCLPDWQNLANLKPRYIEMWIFSTPKDHAFCQLVDPLLVQFM